MTKKENVKLSEIVKPNVLSALEKLSEVGIKAKAAIHVSKALVQLQNQVTEYDKVRIEALKKYVNLDDNGKIIETPEVGVRFKSAEDKTLFAKELEELLAQEVEVIKLSQKLFEDEDVKIESWVFVALSPFLYE
jgi:hypothetical protein